MELTQGMVAGLGPKTFEQLQKAGVLTVEGLLELTAEAVAERSGVALATVRKLQEAFEKQKAGMAIKTAAELLDMFAKRRRIMFGIPALDEVLRGGINHMEITEFYGMFGSGKTQVCFWLAARALVMYPDEYVFWIDTENSFRAERVKRMLRNIVGDVGDKEERVSAAMKRLAYIRTPLVDDQVRSVEVLRDFHQQHKVSLVIVDSLMAQFRNEFMGREMLPERAKKLNPHLHDLMYFSEEQDVAVVVTNQVQSNPDAFFGDPTMPVGGNILGHMAKVIMYIRKGKGESRIVRVMKAPDLPNGEAVFLVTEDGLAEMPSTARSSKGAGE